MKKIINIIILVTLCSCSIKTPKNINNACSIIHQFPNWYYYMVKSYNKWGIPINIQMAFIYQESSFRAKAKPAMRYYLNFIPKGRISSAYGYAQALLGTWEQYKNETKQFFVSRSNYSDATDFIGWYLNNVYNRLNISKVDSYNLYLAYHIGINGYKRGKYKNNSFLKKYALKTNEIAQKYAKQLRNCKIPKKSFFLYMF